MSLRCSEISSRVGTKLGLATLAAEAVSASLIMLLMLAILFHLHPADGVCECCSTFRLVGLVMALLRGHTGHLMDWLATNSLLRGRLWFFRCLQRPTTNICKAS